MTNVLMWYVGDTHGETLVTEEATTTIEPIRTDNELAEQQHAPGWNELDTDESGQLTGLASRVVGADTTDTVKYEPWWVAGADELHNPRIDEQVSSSGTAAAREVAGQQGHGTMQYATSIDPVIREGAAFGNDYFVSNPAGIQDGAGNYMNPTDVDNWAHAFAQREATQASRSAYNNTLYADFIGGK